MMKLIKYKSHKRRSFSLAEVLVTLTVIGVLAAMTIPPLVQNYQKQEYVTKLKKAYSQINATFKQIMADEGVFNFGDTDFYNGADINDPARNDQIDAIIKKYFKVLKTCKSGDGSCKIHFTSLSGANLGNAFETGYVFYTIDNMAIELLLRDECMIDISAGSNGYTGPLVTQCGELLIDINSPQKPNKYGRDVFLFVIAGNGMIYPFTGIDYANAGVDHWDDWDSSFCGKRGSSDITDVVGNGCAARIMEESWEMNY